MDCKKIEQKIFANQPLGDYEKEHLSSCVDCKETFNFNNYISKQIKEKVLYPEFKLTIPGSIYVQNKKEKLYFVLKPALNYAFLLVLGIFFGYFVGNIINFDAARKLSNRQDNEKGYSGSMKINSASPIAKNSSNGSDKVLHFAIPIDENTKKELKLYAGVILIESARLKNIIENCKTKSHVTFDLKENDVIVEVNGIPVDNQETLEKNITNNECNEMLLKIMRNGQMFDKKIISKIRK